MFYHRLLSSQEKESVSAEIHKTEQPINPKDYIKSPAVLEFLNIKPSPNFYEKDLETHIINHLIYYTREMMNEGDSQPIGIMLCADKSEALLRYTLPENNSQIFASKYMLYLPTEEELKKEIFAVINQ
jgi:hypothetical protein